MTTVIVQNQVKDFAKWKAVYDTKAGMRKSGGELSDDIYRDVDDPNNVTVILKWDSVENARKFTSSPELRASMQKAGVIGPSKVTFLKEA